jgi:hypothetical protein
LVCFQQIITISESAGACGQLFFLWMVELEISLPSCPEYLVGLSLRLLGGVPEQKKGNAFSLVEHHQ